MASTDQTENRELKHPISESEIDQKISESSAGDTGDDINSDKYKKKTERKKEADRGPDFNKYSKQEDGDTSVNAGVFK